MNKNEIESMPAGREMDMLIAEKIFNFTDVTDNRFPPHGEFTQAYVDHSMITGYENGRRRDIPFYSTDIESAWNVVGKKEIDGWSCVIENLRGVWQCTFAKVGNTGAYCTAKQAPLAICRAALLAVVPAFTEGGV